MHEQLRTPTDEDEDPYAYMNDWAFRRYHRLSREAFDHLLELISSDLEPVSRRGARGHLASPIGARTQLSVALRILAGGSYLDVSHSHRVSRPTCFTIVDRVVDAINSCEELDLPLVPALDACEAGDSSMLDEITARFDAVTGGVMKGCVGAIDGWLAAIWKPPSSGPHAVEAPILYMCRKHFFSLNVQAIAGADRRFLWAAVRNPGSTCDAQALR